MERGGGAAAEEMDKAFKFVNPQRFVIYNFQSEVLIRLIKFIDFDNF